MSAETADVNNATIKKLLQAKGISQAELARRCGYSHQSAVNNKMMEHNKWTVKDLVTIAKTVGVPMDFLFRDVTLVAVDEEGEAHDLI